MAQSLNELIEKLKKDLIEQANNDFKDAMEYTIGEVETEARKMYDTMITEFYSYKTVSYIRHWEQVPGTQKGSNLYYANNIKKRHSNGIAYLYINFNSDEMAGGYQWDDPAGVLKSVIEGGRGPLMEPWEGHYVGKYFSFSGTIEDAFNKFVADYDDIIFPIFEKKWHALGW